jgi:SAM-dependent methyltransferase
MNPSRRWTNLVRYLLDEWLPPALRDAYWLNRVLFPIVLGKHYRVFLDFRANAYRLDDEGMSEWNRRSLPGLLKRPTDLNQASIDWLLAQDFGTTVLDAGCGTGFLAEKLALRYRVTACDTHLSRRGESSKATYVEARVDALPFADRSFETVVCTHTLEHVRYPWKVIAELRRVARYRLVIVVPLQRPYRHTIDMHLQYFPYPESFLLLIEPERKYRYRVLDGDLLYDESVDAAAARSVDGDRPLALVK